MDTGQSKMDTMNETTHSRPMTVSLRLKAAGDASTSLTDSQQQRHVTDCH